MTDRVVYLLPDTNLFIQCQPVQQLAWGELIDADEIHLIVCRPVQSEVDKQKNRGNDRVGKRARQTHSLFKSIIAGAQDGELIRDANPRVKLYVEPAYRPSEELRGELDFTVPDEALVGCLHAFQQAHPERHTSLLTHDSGPMATAKMLGLPFISIPETWLIPPESNEVERERNRLQDEVSRLRRAEPQFHMECVDGGGNPVESLVFEYVHYDRLEESDIDTLISALKNHLPMATDFGSSEPAERKTHPGIGVYSAKEIYTPAVIDEIARYKETQYPQWIEECRNILRELDSWLQRLAPRPSLIFLIDNQGTRPGDDTLVTITAKGSFHILPSPLNNDDDGGEPELDQPPRLPAPPEPPRGKWTRATIGSSLAALKLTNYFDLPVVGSVFSMADVPELGLLSTRLGRDPNAFYYKDGRPSLPVETFRLECTQFRHGVDPERIEVDIHLDLKLGAFRGAVECRIEAANLSDPEAKSVPIKITINREYTYKRAEEMLTELLRQVGA